MRAAAVPVLLCAAALSAQSWPTFFSAYLDGLDAQKRNDHALAARAFARAIALEPQPGKRVKTYGLNFLQDYSPYLRLAESALALGDLAGAEAALAQSERRAVEPAAERNALRERLRRKLAQAAPPAPPAAAQPAAQSAAQSAAGQSAAAQPAAAQPAAAAPAPHPAGPVPPAPPGPGTAASLPAVPQAPAVRQESRRGSGPAAPSAAPPLPAPAHPATPAQPAASPIQPPPAMAQPQPAAGQAQPAAATEPAAAPVRRWSWGLALAALLPAGAILSWRLRRSGPRPQADPAATLPLRPVPEAVPGASGLSFGPYLARHVLGRGGCATAYYGCHRETGAEVAIKVPHPHLAEDQGFRTRFRREASLGALLDHPRVVKILDPGPQEGDLWLAMAFIRGTTLEAHMVGKGPLPVAQAVAIAADIAEAIAYAHAKGVVHRDLKPANVMLNEDGAVVMDFGIARMTDAAMTSNTMFLGTPLYCAPEGILGAKVGPPADRYALGVILFEMLAGHPPFHSDTLYKILEAQRSEPLPDLALIRPYTPPRLIRLVERLCAKTPEDRPEDPETLAILKELRTSMPPPAAVPQE